MRAFFRLLDRVGRQDVVVAMSAEARFCSSPSEVGSESREWSSLRDWMRRI